MPGCNASKTRLKAAGESFGRMARMTASRILVTLTLLAAMTAVTACGRKSGLDTPYEAAVQARKDAEKAKQPVPPEPEKPVEDRKFVLDPLI
jgi:predicted small lipoprotein YifL